MTANAVLPGSRRTRLLEQTGTAYSLVDVEEFVRHQRLCRLFQPAKVTALVHWLVSAEASATAGVALEIDGGFVG